LSHRGRAVQPGRAADAAGAACGLGAIHPAIRYGLSQHRNPQPSVICGDSAFLALQGSTARALPGSCLVRRPSTLHTPASGAADAWRSAAILP